MYDKHDTGRAIDAHRRDVVVKLRGPQMHFVVVVVLVEHVLESPRGARDTTLVSLEAPVESRADALHKTTHVRASRVFRVSRDD